MTACLGVILDQATNTQTFFGGGECENESKQISSTEHSHNNDIMSMSVNTHGDRQWAVTGQVGKWPSVFVWNTQTGEKKKRFNLQKDARAVTACAISHDGKYIATADRHNDHNVKIFDVDSGDFVYGDKGGPDMIYDLAFTNAPGKYTLWSAGIKAMLMWSPE